MTVLSAGILAYRVTDGRLQVMLVHPGGPFWANRDAGAWTIPKGLIAADEAPLDAARREFHEETGFEAHGTLLDLGELRQPSGKLIHAWAVQQNLDTDRIVSNRFSLEWPRNSGTVKEYPEVDRGQWFDIETARVKILKGQATFIGRLLERLGCKSV